MANLRLTITRTSPSGSISPNKDFSDSDLDRLQAAAIAQLQEQEISNPTSAQIANYLFSRVVADFKTFTRNHEAKADEASRTNIGL